MMKVSLIVAVIAAAVFIIAWAPTYDRLVIYRAVADAKAADEVASKARSFSISLTPGARAVLGTLPGFIRPGSERRKNIEVRIWSVGTRVAMLTSSAPHKVVWLAGFFLLGLARRGAAARGAAWSSSTYTRLGFYGILTSSIALVAYVFSGLPFWFVHVPLDAGVLSAYLYVGNTPCKV